MIAKMNEVRPTSYCGEGSVSDDSSFYSDDSVGSGPSVDNGAVVEAQAKAITGKQNRAICWLRGTVIMVILVSILLVSVVVYLATQYGEETAFEHYFEVEAITILDVFNANLEQQIGSVESLAISFTSYAKEDITSWPLVSLANFEIRATTILDLTSGASISFIPVVTSERRSDWEEYAQVSSEWIQQGIDFEKEMESSANQGHRSLQNSSLDFSNGFSSSIYRLDQEQAGGDAAGIPVIEDGSDPYLPIWQSSPVVPELVNFNLNSTASFSDALQAALQSKQAVMSRFFDDSVLNPLSKALSESDNQDAPFNTLHFPVFDGFANTGSVVGFLTLVSSWSTYFVDVLPDDMVGIYVVVENGCEQSHTFQLSGRYVKYMGEGDLHDKKLNDLEYSSTATVERRGVQLNTDFCPYTLRVYPSNATRDKIVTKRAGLYASFVVIVFSFILLVFLAYDCIVERRQIMVSKMAVENRVIVASLFPEAVHARLFNHGKGVSHDTLPSRSTSSIPESAPLRLQKVLKGDVENGMENDDKPIADLFPNATVFFGDIAGFTAW
jgi:hypothetical protein